MDILLSVVRSEGYPGCEFPVVDLYCAQVNVSAPASLTETEVSAIFHHLIRYIF